MGSSYSVEGQCVQSEGRVTPQKRVCQTSTLSSSLPCASLPSVRLVIHLHGGNSKTHVALVGSVKPYSKDCPSPGELPPKRWRGRRFNVERECNRIVKIVTIT